MTTDTSPCDVVAERVALGDALGELAAHAETCDACRGLVATAAHLGVAHEAGEPRREPGLGFAARMTVGAQHRLDVRRKRRVMAGAGLAVAAAAVGVFVVTRTPASTAPDQPEAPRPAVALERDDSRPPVADPADPQTADALRTLVRFSDVEHNLHVSAHWRRIERPLAPYRIVLKGTQP